MIDIEKVDKLFEVGRAIGAPMQFRILDKKVVLPVDQLAQAVASETGEAIPEEGIRARAVEGWFPLLGGAGLNGELEGAPLYAPSRIGLFLKLQRQGYGTDELRLIADLEEEMIENVLIVDDLAYVEDDLETLVLYTRGRIESLKHGVFEDKGAYDRKREIEEAKRELEFLCNLEAKGIPDRLKVRIEKHAFRVRAFNDIMRIYLLDIERQRILAGYSPLVVCKSQLWSQAEGFSAEGILWEHTVQAAMAYGGGSQVPPIRIPGFLLRGDLVLPTRTLRPAEYGSLWREHDLDGYLECWAKLRGERRCLNCFGPLPEDAGERKRFCGEKCRNAAKQRRFRERNPEAVERAQKRYWESLDS